MYRRSTLLTLLLCSSFAYAQAEDRLEATPIADREFRELAGVDLAPLDLARIAAEDAVTDSKYHDGGMRFAVPTDVTLSTANAGTWSRAADGSWLWRLRVSGTNAAHLNFGFRAFALPEGAALTIQRPDGRQQLGPYTRREQTPSGQLWTPILVGSTALLQVTAPDGTQQDVRLDLARVSQGYRAFGARNPMAKSGSCNMDVACLGASDTWNNPRGSVGAITVSGTDTCTGSLLNNTSNNRRMLFATARHCSITAANVANVLVYWRFENPTCRTPGSAASGVPIPKPATTSSGLAWLAATNNPFGGGGAGNTRSDWTLIELNQPNASGLNLYWAAWDRRDVTTTVDNCASPPQANPSDTVGLCASIHHPSVDEKRITFLDRNLQVGNIASATGVHWHTFWAGANAANSPPVLPNLPPPVTTPVVNGVTEPGSSGSPVYSADKRIVGVLSGGPSACGSTGNNLSDFYGALFHAYEGAGLGTCVTTPTPSTFCMRPYLDPAGLNPEFLDGIAEGPGDLFFQNSFED